MPMAFFYVLALVGVVLLFRMYSRVHRPPPSVLTGLIAVGALGYAIVVSLPDGTLWFRLVMAGLWIFLAVGVIIAHLSLNKRAARGRKAIYLDRSDLTLDEVVRRLQSLGFAVRTSAEYDGQSFLVIAHSRTTTGTGHPVNTFFMMATFDSLDMAALKAYGSTCLNYANEHTSGSRLWRRRGMCFPVALVPAIDSALADSVRAREPNADRIDMQLPIIWETTNGQLHYSRATTWQLDMRDLKWDSLRQTIVKVFRP